MKYIIISNKTHEGLVEVLNSKYTIKELGNTWIANGVVYQSFLGEKIEPSAFAKRFMDKPEVTKDTPVTPKLTTKDIAAIEVDTPAKPKKKRKSPAKPKKKE